MRLWESHGSPIPGEPLLLEDVAVIALAALAASLNAGAVAATSLAKQLMAASNLRAEKMMAVAELVRSLEQLPDGCDCWGRREGA